MTEIKFRCIQEIFDIDKQEDWVEFFKTYPDVVEPKECLDPEMEKKLTYSSKSILADEDNLEDDLEEDEYEFEPTCSSSSVSQLPPTPDMIARYKAESCEYLL